MREVWRAFALQEHLLFTTRCGRSPRLVVKIVGIQKRIGQLADPFSFQAGAGYSSSP